VVFNLLVVESHAVAFLWKFWEKMKKELVSEVQTKT